MRLEYNLDFIEDKSIKSNIKKAISILEKAFYSHREESSFFLNPFEIKVIDDIARTNNIDILYLSTNEDNERRIFVANPYSEYLNIEDYISVLEFSQNNIKHPDVLGALLHLGLDRNEIGNIFIAEDFAEFSLLSKDKDFVKFNLTKIKNEGIKLNFKEKSIMHSPQIDYIYKDGFITSLRLDNIVSEFINLSRSKAKTFIKRKLVKVNYQVIENPASMVEERSLVSIRSEGRFIFDKIIGKSKKNKYHIEYRKYKWFIQLL